MLWYKFSPPEGHLTPNLWVPLKLANLDSSFGTLQSQIKQTVIEILESKYKNTTKTAFFSALVSIFTTRGAPDPKVNGATVKNRSKPVQNN